VGWCICVRASQCYNVMLSLSQNALQSRIMNQERRTTISAPSDALATLELEARRRGVPMTAVVAEAVVEKAAALRRARRPRLGTGASGGRSPGAARATADPVSDHPR